MHITLNGKRRDIAPGLTLLDLIGALGLDPAVVVAERNGDIVPGARFAATVLDDGDRLELLSFVGGG
jgi:thiamine biosynthesis protein ThiS